MRVHATAQTARLEVYSSHLRAESGVMQTKAYVKLGKVQNRTPLRCTGLACPCAHELFCSRRYPIYLVAAVEGETEAIAWTSLAYDYF